MKKNTAISLALLLLLSGCKDATAALKDASSTVMKVGTQTVTKGDIYTIMNTYAGASQVVSDATKKITAIEVEVTDEMRESAESSLNMYKTIYGDSFNSYLENAGMTEESYIEDYLIPGLQADALTDKYIEENFDALVERYHPVKATVLQFTSLDNANAALSALKDGTMTPEEAAEEYESATSGTPEIITIENNTYDVMALALIRSATKDDGWSSVTSQTSGEVYVIRVEENDASAMKDEVTSTFGSVADIDDQATAHYFEKYGFRVYDIDLYNALKDSNPGILTQEVPISAQ